MTDTLLSEYETIIASVGQNASDDQIIAALACDSDWTREGARDVLQLARTYGTSILRNSLALAAAMEIEDGQAGY